MGRLRASREAPRAVQHVPAPAARPAFSAGHPGGGALARLATAAAVRGPARTAPAAVRGPAAPAPAAGGHEQDAERAGDAVAAGGTGAASSAPAPTPPRGAPLPAPLRGRLEERLGARFESVRIHADERSGEEARRRGADAFTRGADVYFGPGAWAPDTARGLHLLGHEARHVMQQGAAPARARDPSSGAAAPAPPAAAAGAPQLRRSDFEVTGRYQPPTNVFGRPQAVPGRDPARRVFFELDSDDLSETEKETKLRPIAEESPGHPLLLRGFASEEGASGHNLRLGRRRAQAVDRALGQLGHGQPRRVEANADLSQSDIDYRWWRAVEVEVDTGSTGAATTRTREAQSVPCETQSPGFEELHHRVVDIAIRNVETAARRMTLGSADDRTAVQNVFPTLFGTSADPDPLDPAKIDLVRGNLNALADQLRVFRNVDRIVCGTRADPLCSAVAGAYAQGRGPTATMTVCPTTQNRIETMTHESAHATPGFGAKDQAYRGERLIRFLAWDVAKTNTDSYVLLVEGLQSGTLGDYGARGLTTYGVRSFTSPELRSFEEALGWVESGVTSAYGQTAGLYLRVNQARGAGAWSDRYESLLSSLADHFPLRDPGERHRLPRARDAWRIAAIYDRFGQMRTLLQLRIQGEKDEQNGSPVTRTHWGTPASRSVFLEPAFFGWPLEQRVRTLLRTLAAATPGVSAPLAPHYAEAVAIVRQFMGLAWPWTP